MFNRFITVVGKWPADLMGAISPKKTGVYFLKNADILIFVIGRVTGWHCLLPGFAVMRSVLTMGTLVLATTNPSALHLYFDESAFPMILTPGMLWRIHQGATLTIGCDFFELVFMGQYSLASGGVVFWVIVVILDLAILEYRRRLQLGAINFQDATMLFGRAAAVPHGTTGANIAKRRSKLYHNLILPSPESVRLLKIRGVDTVPGRLECDLKVFSHDKIPPYKALSYTWGNPFAIGTVPSKTVASYEKPASIKIVCNGIDFLVRRNLKEAFDALVDTECNDWLWIDAICINQQDDAERFIQVSSRMGDIFSNAREVLVWLGVENIHDRMVLNLYQESRHLIQYEIRPVSPPSTPRKDRIELDQAFFNNKTFYNKMLRTDVDVVPARESKYRQQSSAKLDNHIGDVTLSTQLLCRRQWFARSWVLQETALAKDIKIICGSIVVPLEHTRILFGMACPDDHLYKPFVFRSRYSIYGSAYTSSQGMSNDEVRMLLFRMQAGGAEYPVQRATYLAFLIHEARSSAASDPRDKVFSMLGIANIQFPPKEDADVLDSSYSTTIEDVYYWTSIYLLLRCANLTVLSLVEDPVRRRLNMPSWVPDLSVDPLVRPFHLMIEIGLNVHPGFLPGFKFSDQGMPAAGPVLRIAAGFLDQVVDVLAFTVDTLWTYKGLSFEEFSRFWIEIPSPYMNGQDSCEALWQCMSCYDTTRKLKPGVMIANKNFRRWLETMIEENWRAYLARLHAKYPHADKGEMQKLTTRELVAFTRDHRRLERLSEATTMDCGLPRSDAFFARNVYEMTTEGRNFDRHLVQLFETIIRKSGIESHPFGPLMEVMRTKLDPDSTSDDNKSPGDYAFTARVKEHASNRKLFRTAKGYIGLGPASTQLGDHVMILESSRIPFILRPREDLAALKSSRWDIFGRIYVEMRRQGELEPAVGVYNTIGEAWVHGIMYGMLRTDEERPWEEMKTIHIV